MNTPMVAITLEVSKWENSMEVGCIYGQMETDLKADGGTGWSMDYKGSHQAERLRVNLRNGSMGIRHEGDLHCIEL